MAAKEQADEFDNFNDGFEETDEFLPRLNLGCGLDIPTGNYQKGAKGENILNAGLAYLTGIVGDGNKFKSTILWYMLLMVLNRYPRSSGLAYDTEISLEYERLLQLAWLMEYIGGIDLRGDKRLILTNAIKYSGNKFFEQWTARARYRMENPEKFLLASPFIDKDGRQMKILNPHITGVDSLSNLTADAIIKMQKENEIGESGLNTEAMRSSLIKSQMLMQLPTLSGGAGCYMLMSAHIGEGIQMDPFAPPTKQLQFLKQNLKFKNVPQKFRFLMNNCWYAENAQVMERDKMPLYPRSSDDNLTGDTDLNKVTLRNLRGKFGVTGIPLEIVVSQSEGVLPGLTALNALKSNKFGLGGNDRNYYADLYPDEVMGRTTARDKIQTNYKVARAMEISMEMMQIYDLWHTFDSRLKMEPKEVYAKVKEKGYHWDQLLETRGWWTFNNEDPGLRPFLSTKDILEIAAGDYKPYWIK